MFKKVFGAVSVLAVLLMVTTASASNAQPGSMLYGYKVQVNDRVNSWFAVSYIADVENQIDMIEERLSEIDALIAAGALTPEKAVELKKNLVRQIENAQATIADPNSKLTPAQIKQLKEGLDRMKVVLKAYSESLTILDEVAAEAPAKKTYFTNSRSGKSQNTSPFPTTDAIIDVIESIEEEIADAIIDLDPALATSTDEVGIEDEMIEETESSESVDETDSGLETETEADQEGAPEDRVIEVEAEIEPEVEVETEVTDESADETSESAETDDAETEAEDQAVSIN